MERRGFSNNPPVQVGDEVDVTIEAVGEKGDGVAKKDGFVLFVPGGKQGQNVKVKINRVLKSVGFAEIIGEGAAPAEGSSNGGQSQEPAIQDMPDAEPEDQPEDTEDFGEEPEDEESEDESSEEEQSEDEESKEKAQ